MQPPRRYGQQAAKQVGARYNYPKLPFVGVHCLTGLSCIRMSYAASGTVRVILPLSAARAPKLRTANTISAAPSTAPGASARRRAAALARLHALTPGSLSLPSDMDLDEMLLYADLDLDELEGLAATGEGGEAGGTPGGRVGASSGGRGSAGGAAAVAAALGLQGLGVLDVDVDVDLDALSSASDESSANLSKLVAQGERACSGGLGLPTFRMEHYALPCWRVTL